MAGRESDGCRGDRADLSCREARDGPRSRFDPSQTRGPIPLSRDRGITDHCRGVVCSAARGILDHRHGAGSRITGAQRASSADTWGAAGPRAAPPAALPRLARGASDAVFIRPLSRGRRSRTAARRGLSPVAGARRASRWLLARTPGHGALSYRGRPHGAGGFRRAFPSHRPRCVRALSARARGRGQRASRGRRGSCPLDSPSTSARPVVLASSAPKPGKRVSRFRAPLPSYL